jgi:membrane protein
MTDLKNNEITDGQDKSQISRGQYSFPGFGGTSFREVAKIFIGGIRKGSVITRASSIAFLVFLASLPSIIFFFSLIPFLPVQNFKHELLDIIRMLLPSNASESITKNIDIILVKRKGIPIMGLAIAMYFAVSAMMGVIDAFNSTIHAIESRKIFEKIRVAVILVIVMLILIVVSVTLVVLEKIFTMKLVSAGILHVSIFKDILILTRWLIIAALIFCGISSIYYLGPAKRNRWKFVSPGSWVATILTLLASFGFSFFVNNYAPFNKIYGSIGTIMAILIWMNFNSIALLLGFELNASISNAPSKKLNEEGL